MKVAVPDVAYLGKITPPTAQHAIRQGKVVAHKVAGSLGYGKKRSVLANPINVQLSGFPAKAVTRTYHVDAIPRSSFVGP